MNVLIVVESYFGNTSMIAHAIAEGIQITYRDACIAFGTLPAAEMAAAQG